MLRALFNRNASCMSPSLNWGQIIMNKGKYKFLQKLFGCVARKGYLNFSGFRYIKFHKLRYMKGLGNLSFRYLTGPSKYFEKTHLSTVPFDLLGTT